MIEGKILAAKRAGILDHSFYFLMSLLVAAVVVYGFSHTVNENLLHPSTPRPVVLYVHAALFTGWVLFFILQSVLVRTRNVKVHRRVGWFGLALGVAVPMVGMATAIVMSRFRIKQGSSDSVPFLIVPFFDMFVFSVAFGLAFYWRKKPEIHRRLILIATCSLTIAAFTRFPSHVVPDNWWYGGVDLLILLGVTRDLMVMKRIHAVYLYGLPAMMLGQFVAMYIYLSAWPVWLRIAHRLLD